MHQHVKCRYWLVPVLFIAFLAGCDVFSDFEGDEQVVITEGVYVANQGNFSDGNGTVTVYDPQTGAASTLVQGIGSIIQSIEIGGDQLFVVANSAGRIDAFHVETGQKIGQVDSLLSPRYMEAVAPTIAYVSNLYGSEDSFTGGKVSVVDLERREKVSDITVGDNPEGIAVVGRVAWVANYGFGAGHTLTAIDARVDTVLATVTLEGCDGPRFIVADQQGEVWAFCTGNTIYDESGNVIEETNGAVFVLNGGTGAIRGSLEVDGQLGADSFGQDAYYSRERGEIYVVKDDNTILQYNTARNQFVGVIGPFEGDPISAVAFDQVSEHLYLGRNAGFTESGSVTIHQLDGTQVGSFAAGVAPSYIIFRRATQ